MPPGSILEPRMARLAATDDDHMEGIFLLKREQDVTPDH
jgi:hypothetical protein